MVHTFTGACIRGSLKIQGTAPSLVGKFSAEESIFLAYFGIFRHILAFGGTFPLFIGIFPFLVGKFRVRPPLHNGLCTPLYICIIYITPQ